MRTLAYTATGHKAHLVRWIDDQGAGRTRCGRPIVSVGPEPRRVDPERDPIGAVCARCDGRHPGRWGR